MRKKIWTLLLASVMVLSVTACGASDSDVETEKTDGVVAAESAGNLRDRAEKSECEVYSGRFFPHGCRRQ